MKLEHIAYQVAEPIEVSRWYCEHLGLTLVRESDVSPFMHFLTDDSGSICIEIYHNPKVDVPDYASMDPLYLHIAFASLNVLADRDRLLKAGARLYEDAVQTPLGDTLVMLRDPWGFALQLCQRPNPVIRWP